MDFKTFLNEGNKKYSTQPEGKLLRITALKNFGDVKKGDEGGLIQKEYNLSQSGDCWVYDNAKVIGNGRVLGDAKIFDNVEVQDYAVVKDKAEVRGNTKVISTATVGKRAKLDTDVFSGDAFE